jgi:murein DD-endopeptidase MepM/ murein hydrolase activator NlpD
MFKRASLHLNTVYYLLITVLLSACTAPVSVPTATSTAMTTATSALAPKPAPTLAPTVIPSLTPTPVIEVCSPLMNHALSELPGFISRGFITPSANQDDGHHGVDLSHYRLGKEAGILGDPVQAVLPGKIAAVVNDRPPYGNMLIIEVPYQNLPPALVELAQIPAGESLYLLYAHLEDRPDLTIGQPVACGQNISQVGNTGCLPCGPHLHFETRWGPPGITFNGMAYYTADATPDEMKNYRTWRMSDTFHLFDPMILLSLPQP